MRRLLPWLENALRRYPWVITLAALIPCAYFAARGTSEMLGARLFAADTEALARPLPQTLASPTPEAGASAQNRHVRDRTAVVHRNVFDSDAGCLDCADAAADGEPAIPADASSAAKSVRGRVIGVRPPT